jgi:hypothetical protein
MGAFLSRRAMIPRPARLTIVCSATFFIVILIFIVIPPPNGEIAMKMKVRIRTRRFA